MLLPKSPPVISLLAGPLEVNNPLGAELWKRLLAWPKIPVEEALELFVLKRPLPLLLAPLDVNKPEKSPEAFIYLDYTA